MIAVFKELFTSWCGDRIRVAEFAASEKRVKVALTNVNDLPSKKINRKMNSRKSEIISIRTTQALLIFESVSSAGTLLVASLCFLFFLTRPPDLIESERCKPDLFRCDEDDWLDLVRSCESDLELSGDSRLSLLPLSAAFGSIVACPVSAAASLFC